MFNLIVWSYYNFTFLRAHKGFLPSVQPLVRLQLTTLDKRLPTIWVVTQIRPLSLRKKKRYFSGNSIATVLQFSYYTVLLMIYTQYTTYNTKAIKFKIGTRRSIVFCFHRPSINVILPVQHIAVASGLTGVYMTFPASNSAENGNHGTPTFLKAPIFWKIGQYILMFGVFFVLNAPTPLSLLPVCVLL